MSLLEILESLKPNGDVPKRADIQGSNDFKRLNPHLHEANAGPELPHAEPERDHETALVGTATGEAQIVGRTVVRFTGYRVRPLDADNFAASCKGVLDGLRHSHIITDDDPTTITLETGQVRVKHFKDEKTVVFIDDGQP